MMYVGRHSMTQVNSTSIHYLNADTGLMFVKTSIELLITKITENTSNSLSLIYFLQYRLVINLICVFS